MSQRKPIEKQIKKSEGFLSTIVIKYKNAPLKDKVYVHKLMMGVISSIVCSIFGTIQMYTYVNFGFTFFAQSISVGSCWLMYLGYFLVTWKLLKYDEKLGGKSKILMEGVGAFIFVWIFIWTIVNTLAWVSFYGMPPILRS
ncbi:MAG: hypothetical protein EAX96_05345 [Candidatus Lokiarchaeota archaeon]|nr:hypothetical protein [Candidatus Lokiarchaeota archaeon]